LIAGTLALVLVATSAAAAEGDSWRIHGLVFGDYYWFAAHHDPRWQHQQGFWLRRAYLGYDQELGESFSMRLRLEVNSSGDLEDEDLVPYVKDAYLTWAFARKHELRAGIQPSLTFDAEEQFWGLRHVEKTPADLYRIDSSRDLGVSLSGAVLLDGLHYAAQFGNESGTGSETDEYKILRLFGSYERDAGVHAEGLFAYARRPGDQDRKTAKGLLGYRRGAFRFAGQYLWQQRLSGQAGVADQEIRIWSAFGAFDLVAGKATLFARWDDAAARQGDGAYALGLPGASEIEYLPISADAPFRTWILGFEWRLHPSVRASPNVEWVAYRTSPGGLAVEDDVVPRITFFWTW
jgi:Phosphate-selective porin O and P